MKREEVFGASLFAAGFIFQAAFSYLWRTSFPSPQWLLLAVLAVGARGKINTAQSLGFFWGLILDAGGPSLFGAQAWILAAAGYITGRFSKEVDSDRPLAQAILALGGTLFHLTILTQIELFFRRSGPPLVPSIGAILGQFAMNVLAAPLVFWIVRLWSRHDPSVEEDHVFRP